MTAHLELVQETDIRRIPMIEFDFESYDEDIIRKRIMNKYHTVRGNVLQQESRMEGLLTTKNIF
jgi:hypothetical protein